MRRVISLIMGIVLLFACRVPCDAASSEMETTHPFLGIPIGSSLAEVEKELDKKYGASLHLLSEDEHGEVYFVDQEILVGGLECYVSFEFFGDAHGKMLLSSGTVYFPIAINDGDISPEARKQTLKDGYAQFMHVYQEYADMYDGTGICVDRRRELDGHHTVIEYESIDDLDVSEISEYTADCNFVLIEALFNNIVLDGRWRIGSNGCVWQMFIKCDVLQQSYVRQPG